MQHKDYIEKVSKEVEAQWAAADLVEGRKLNFRCKVAQELYNAEPDDMRTVLEEELEAEHQEELQVHTKAMEGPSDNPKDQAE
jgi:hypothetical protein